MNTRDRRPSYLPKALTLLLALGVLVSAVANAPGWLRGQPATKPVATNPVLQAVDPAVEPVTMLAMAEPMALGEVPAVGLDSDTISHGFDSAGTAELTLAALYESDESEQEHPFVADTTVNPVGGHRLRLASRTPTVGGSPGGASGASGSTGGASGGAPNDSQAGEASQGESGNPSQPQTPAVGDSPGGETMPSHDTTAQSGAGDSTPIDPPPAAIGDDALPPAAIGDDALPPAAIGDDALANAGSPSNPDSSIPDTKPPADDVVTVPPTDQRPIDFLPTDLPVQQPVSVPEPSSLALLILGLAGIAGTRRRRAKVQK